MTIKTQYVKLVARKEEPGGYEVLVFQDLDSRTYRMCTKLPNWNTKTPLMHVPGYLQSREFIAGEDKWYDFQNNKHVSYCYTGLYFWDFVEKKEKTNTELILKD